MVYGLIICLNFGLFTEVI